MTTYIDHYFDTADVSAFLELLATEVNILGPQHGSAATPAMDDENGQPMPARPAIGDPSRIYIAVRSDNSLPVPAGATITEPTLARAILGVWA